MYMYLIKYLKCTDHGSLRSSFFMKSLASSLVPEKYSSSKLKWKEIQSEYETRMHLVEAHCPLRDRNQNIYTFILQWPWPWDDFELGRHNNTISWLQQKNLVFYRQKNPFYQCDLDPMILTHKLDLDIVKMPHHTKKKVSMTRHSKVIARTNTHTHRGRQTDIHAVW